MIFFCTEVNGSKNLHGTNGTSTEFTLDTTEGNLKKREMGDGWFSSRPNLGGDWYRYIYSKFENRLMLIT